jgi:hypothetical protein
MYDAIAGIAPRLTQARPAIDIGTADRSATAVSAARDESYPSSSPRRRPDEQSTGRSETAVSAARDEPHDPISQQRLSHERSTDRSTTLDTANSAEPSLASSQPPRPNDHAAAFQRDLAIAVAHGLPAHKPNLPATGLPRGKNAIPGGLAFRQLHLPPEERKPQRHLEQTMRNLVEFGSLDDPANAVENSPASIPSFRETLARAKVERLKREAERDAKKEKVEREEAERQRVEKERGEKRVADRQDAARKITEAQEWQRQTAADPKGARPVAAKEARELYQASRAKDLERRKEAVRKKQKDAEGEE